MIFFFLLLPNYFLFMMIMKKTSSHHTYISVTLHVVHTMHTAGAAGTSTCFAWKPREPRIITGTVIITLPLHCLLEVIVIPIRSLTFLSFFGGIAVYNCSKMAEVWCVSYWTVIFFSHFADGH